MRRPRAQKGAAKERRKKGAKKKVKRMKQPILKTMTLVALITMLLSLVAAVYGQDAENYGVPTTTTESSTRTAKTTDGAQGYVDLSSAMLFENLIIKDFVNSPPVWPPAKLKGVEKAFFDQIFKKNPPTQIKKTF